MKTIRSDFLSISAAVVFSALNGCQHKLAPPDITGFVVSMDSSSKERRLRVEADTTDSVATGKGSPKAIIQFPASIQLHGIRVGCLVSVWYDERYPILDSESASRTSGARGELLLRNGSCAPR